MTDMFALPPAEDGLTESQVALVFMLQLQFEYIENKPLEAVNGSIILV